MLRLNKQLMDALAPSLEDATVEKLCKFLEKKVGNEDASKRPPFQQVQEQLQVLADKKVKVAARAEVAALSKQLLQYYELEKGNPERGVTLGCKVRCAARTSRGRVIRRMCLASFENASFPLSPSCPRATLRHCMSAPGREFARCRPACAGDT